MLSRNQVRELWHRCAQEHGFVMVRPVDTAAWRGIDVTPIHVDGPDEDAPRYSLDEILNTVNAELGKLRELKTAHV